MTPSLFRRVLTLVVALGSASTLLGAPLDSGSLSGRVVLGDAVTPRRGIQVALLDPSTRQVFRSGPTDEWGSFRIDSAPAGDYTLVAESPEGTFVADGSLSLRPGENTPLALRLKAAAPSYQSAAGTSGSAAARGLARWAKWVIAGSIGVAALAVVNDAGDDVEEPATPF